LDDKRLQAQQQIKLRQARITRAVKRPKVMTHKSKGKFNPNGKDHL